MEGYTKDNPQGGESEKKEQILEDPETRVVPPVENPGAVPPPVEDLETRAVSPPVEDPETRVVSPPVEDPETRVVPPPVEDPETRVVPPPVEDPEARVVPPPVEDKGGEISRPSSVFGLCCVYNSTGA